MLSQRNFPPGQHQPSGLAAAHEQQQHEQQQQQQQQPLQPTTPAATNGGAAASSEPVVDKELQKRQEKERKSLEKHVHKDEKKVRSSAGAVSILWLD